MRANMRRDLTFWFALALALFLPGGCDEERRSSPDPPAGPGVTELLERLDPTPSVLEYHEVDELRPEHHGQRLRVHGWVAPGSIMQRKRSSGIRFELVRGDGAITVHYAGPLPEQFQDRLEAIVSGTLSDDGTSIVASELVSKCPSSYDDLPKWPEQGGPR